MFSLERGADTTAQDEKCETASSLASAGDHNEVVKVLRRFHGSLWHGLTTSEASPALLLIYSSPNDPPIVDDNLK